MKSSKTQNKVLGLFPASSDSSPKKNPINPKTHLFPATTGYSQRAVFAKPDYRSSTKTAKPKKNTDSDKEPQVPSVSVSNKPRQNSLDFSRKSREKNSEQSQNLQVTSSLNQEIQEELRHDCLLKKPKAREEESQDADSTKKQGHLPEISPESPVNAPSRIKKDIYESSKTILPSNVVSDLYKVQKSEAEPLFQKDKGISKTSENYSARLSLGGRKTDHSSNKIKEELKNFKQTLEKVKNDFGMTSTTRYPKSENELLALSQRPRGTSPPQSALRTSIKKEGSPPTRVSLSIQHQRQIQNATERSRRKSLSREIPSTKMGNSGTKRDLSTVTLETAELIKELDSLYTRLRERIVRAANGTSKSEFLKANVDVLLSHMDGTLQSFLSLEQNK